MKIYPKKLFLIFLIAGTFFATASASATTATNDNYKSVRDKAVFIGKVIVFIAVVVTVTVTVKETLTSLVKPVVKGVLRTRTFRVVEHPFIRVVEHPFGVVGQALGGVLIGLAVGVLTGVLTGVLISVEISLVGLLSGREELAMLLFGGITLGGLWAGIAVAESVKMSRIGVMLGVFRGMVEEARVFRELVMLGVFRGFVKMEEQANSLEKEEENYQPPDIAMKITMIIAAVIVAALVEEGVERILKGVLKNPYFLIKTEGRMGVIAIQNLEKTGKILVVLALQALKGLLKGLLVCPLTKVLILESELELVSESELERELEYQMLVAALETVLTSVLLAVGSPLTSEFNEIVNPAYRYGSSFCYSYYCLSSSSLEEMVGALVVLASLAELLGCIVALVRGIKMRAERKGKPINTL